MRRSNNAYTEKHRGTPTRKRSLESGWDDLAFRILDAVAKHAHVGKYTPREVAGIEGVYLPKVFEEDQIVKSKSESPAPPRRVCVAARLAAAAAPAASAPGSVSERCHRARASSR